MVKDNNVLVIDIGGTGLKLAEFSTAPGSGVLLERYALKDFPAETTDAGFPEVFARTFQEMIAENQFTARNVRIAITSASSFQRLSKMPPLMTNRIKAQQVATAEARQTVPYPLEEVVWDYQLVRHTQKFEVKPEDGEAGAEPEYETIEEMEALFVAVKDDMLTAITTTLLDLNYEVLSVEIAPTAIFNAAKANNIGTEGCELILDLGGRAASLLFVDGDRIFVRTLPIAGNMITQQIAKEFSISFADAEEMKRKHGFVALGGAYEDSDSEVAATISKIIRNIMTRLHSEITRSINSWCSQYGGGRPVRLLLTGGSSIIPYVPHFFDEKLRIGVEFLNAFPAVGIADHIDKDQLLEVAHLFPTMIGMGVRHVQTCPVEINLRPKVLQSHQALRQKKPFFYISAGCVVLTLLLVVGGIKVQEDYNQRLINATKDQLKKTEEIAKQIKSLKRDYDDCRGEYENAARLLADRRIWLTLLNKLQEITPSNMWFTEITGISSYDPNEQENAEKETTRNGSPMMGNPMMGNPMMAPGPAMGGVNGRKQDADGESGEVCWLRLVGHSLVLDSEQEESVEDAFKKAVQEAKDANGEPFFSSDEGSFTNPKLTLNKAQNNITYFVIYLKLAKPIKTAAE